MFTGLGRNHYQAAGKRGGGGAPPRPSSSDVKAFAAEFERLQAERTQRLVQRRNPNPETRREEYVKSSHSKKVFGPLQKNAPSQTTVLNTVDTLYHAGVATPSSARSLLEAARPSLPRAPRPSDATHQQRSARIAAKVTEVTPRGCFVASRPHSAPSPDPSLVRRMEDLQTNLLFRDKSIASHATEIELVKSMRDTTKQMIKSNKALASLMVGVDGGERARRWRPKEIRPVKTVDVEDDRVKHKRAVFSSRQPKLTPYTMDPAERVETKQRVPATFCPPHKMIASCDYEALGAALSRKFFTDHKGRPLHTKAQIS